MRKIDAVREVLLQHGGVATRKIIYDEFPAIYGQPTDTEDQKAGIRGVVYREMYQQKMFKQVGLGLVGLIEYQDDLFSIAQYDTKETEDEREEKKIKIHTYIQSILIDIGNYKKFGTYCPDKSYEYKQGLKIGDITTVQSIPDFSYPSVVSIAKQIDVLWFCDEQLLFPKKAFEVVDSIGTLATSLNRLMNLEHFDTEYVVLAPEQYRKKYEQTLASKPYSNFQKKFIFNTYTELENDYNYLLNTMRNKNTTF